MSHAIKINRIARNMQMAAYGRTRTAILASIHDALLDALTSAQLVIVADALHTAHQAGKAQAERDVLTEGAIYSPVAGKMLEVR